MIRSMHADEVYPWSLLLDADPDKAIVEGYLDQSQVLIYEEKNTVIGIVVFQQQLDTWEIMNIAVAPDHQNRGIGRRLLQAVEDTLLATAAPETPIRLLIKTGDHSPARFLYQKQGFTIFSCQKNYFVDHYAEPIYEEGRQLFDQIILVKHLICS